MRLILLLMLCGVSLGTEETCETEKTTVTRRLPTTEDCESPKTTTTTTTTRTLPVNYWYEQYLNQPCNQTSPILKNEEHDGTHVVSDLKFYPAETYFMECQEGLSDVAGAWGGYNYGGCIGTNEYGVNGSLVRLVKEAERIDTNSGSEIGPFGVSWECADPLYSEGTGPPIAYDFDCWYYDEEGNIDYVSPQPDNADYEKDYTLVSLNGTSVRLYCLFNSPYGGEFWDGNTYILYSEDEELYHSAKTTYPPPSTKSTTTTTPSGYWYEQYLYTPCEPTSPILKNEQHDGIHIFSTMVIYPAETYFLECQEGMSNVTGAWGGYYYGGCIGTNEYGVSGSLVRLNQTNERVVWTDAGSKVDQFGLHWLCTKYLHPGLTDSPIVPPLNSNYTCWYYDGEGNLKSFYPESYDTDYEPEYANVTLNGETYRFYCLENYPYGTMFDPYVYYELVREDDALEKWKTTPAQEYYEE